MTNRTAPHPGLGNRYNEVGAMPAYDRMSVLIVDDSKTIRSLLVSALRQIGVSYIAQAADGSEALGKLRANPFNLIISDWVMEPMNGLQLLIEVRADVKLKHIPFIMLTAEVVPEKIAIARDKGCNAYIAKPFNKMVLIDRINKVMKDVA